MPVDEQSLAAFERLVRFFRNLSMGGGVLIALGLASLGLTSGARLAAILGGTCSCGAVMVFVGLRGLRKGTRMADQMRKELRGLN